MKRVDPRGRPSGPGAGLTFDGVPGGLFPVRSLVLVSSSRAYMATRGGNSKKRQITSADQKEYRSLMHNDTFHKLQN